MKIFDVKKAFIIFGDAEHSIIPKEHFDIATPQDLAQTLPVSELCKAINAPALYMVHQVHGIDGVTITESIPLPKPWAYDADYLITSQRGVAIGIATADCIPLLLYDPENEVIAAIHAGWKGMAAGIIEKAIADLQMNHGTKTVALQAWIGPAARSCCYEVPKDVAESCGAPAEALRPAAEEKVFLDLVLTTQSRLLKSGLTVDNINSEYAECTICSAKYHSHRRENHNLKRQLSIIILPRVLPKAKP